MQAWEKFLNFQQQELGAKTVDKWLRSLRILRFDACNLYLEAKDSFQILWFEEHIRKKLQTAFLNSNNKPIKVHLSLPNQGGQQKKERKTVKAAQEKPTFTLKFDELNDLCTFNQFVISDGNILAYKLLNKMTYPESNPSAVNDPEKNQASFNPIYLFGAEGSGKTHLLMSAANALKNHFKNVIYVRAETFTEHVVSAIRSGEMGIFRQTYRNSDVLLIDNVHLFSNKGATQEELFHTFNTLHLAGKHIILSANCSPAELQSIEARLVSRFEWGIVLPLDTLKGDLLKQVLKNKAQALQFTLADKVADFLLSKFSKSTKTLTRALEALILRAHLLAEEKKSAQSYSQTLNVAQATALLTDLLKEEETKALTTEQIVQRVSEYFGIRTEELLGDGRAREFVLPRHLAMYFCRKNLNLSFSKIGEVFSRDHSTVMSSIKLIQSGVDNYDQEIARHYHIILKALNR